jgi:hypothetical protein
VFRARDVDLPKDNVVEFRTYRPPPAVQRGKCISCGAPTVELVRLPALPKLTIVPSATFSNPALLPAPSIHLFYDRRVADIEDNLPKYSGYWRSQLAISRYVFSSLLRGQASA